MTEIDLFDHVCATVAEDSRSGSAPRPIAHGAAQARPPALADFLARQFHSPVTCRATDKSRSVQIDDWHGDVWPGFCHIAVTVLEDDDCFLLEMTNPPCDDAVRELIAGLGKERHEWTTAPRGHTLLRISLTVKDGPFIRKLARAIARVVSWRHVKRTGKRYDIPQWKLFAPRTARSLERFAGALWEYRSVVAAAKRRKRPGDQGKRGRPQSAPARVRASAGGHPEKGPTER